MAQTRKEYERVADAHAKAQLDKQRVPLAKARANALKIDWDALRADKAQLHRRARLRDL